MGDRYYDQSQSYYPPPPQQGQYPGASSASIDRSYASSQQYNPPYSSPNATSSNMHLAPYDADLRRPGSSHAGEPHRHRHRHSHSRNGSRSHSRASRRSRRSSHSGRSSHSDEERSRSRTRDKIKSHKKEIGASLLGAAAGGALGHEFGGGGVATLLGVAAGAFAGDKMEKTYEKKKGEKKARDDDDGLAYGDRYGSSQKGSTAYDPEEDRRRRHHHHGSRSHKGYNSDSDGGRELARGSRSTARDDW